MIARVALALALLGALLAPAAAEAGEFGFKPGAAGVEAVNRDGTPDTQAGSHPYAFKLHFALKTDGAGKTEGGVMRDVRTNLPPGFFGNPAAAPSCPRQEFEGTLPTCLLSTQVGVLKAILPEIKAEVFGPLYNLTPPPGVAAQLGFSAVGFTALLSARLDSEDHYRIHIEASNLPLEASFASATIWGTPADPSHDPERGPEAKEGLSTDAPPLPFLTLPTSCETAPEFIVEADSRLDPGNFVGGDEPLFLRDKGGNPSPLTGCEAVPFSPQVLAAPSSEAAETPAGLGFALRLPNQGLLSTKEGAVTETEPAKTVVTLPAGFAANPAAVSGQGVCTLAQYEAASVTDPGCPGDSRLGTLLATTPLLEEPIEGAVYLAKPHENPVGNGLLALYIIARAPERGAVVKQAGRVDIDQATGQLTTTIEGLPPIPYSGFEVRLREGARAPLMTPQTCGTYNLTAQLYPFSDPATATVRSVPFAVSSGAGGGACAQSEAQLPNNPTLAAGSAFPIAGSYSPFTFKIARADGQQRFSSLEATLPEGLVGRLAGTPYCSEAQIAAAAARTGEGEGALEQSSPSCPAASQIGTVTVGAGAGPSPYLAAGNVYLAGPYKGAPLSIVVITPAIAGPFDLGVVTSRAGLYVDESSAKVTVRSDPLPTILHGFPLDVRSVLVKMDRSNFILNPTSCEEKEITARVTSIAGSTASLKNRFQVGACKGLDFAPKLSLKLSGGTTRAKHPALKAVLTQPPEQANLARFSLTLPPTEFVDPNHVANPCTRPQFNAGACPPSSVLGKVKVFTPLLDEPLQGPIYFRANGGERELPDAVADLNGQVHLISVGFVDAVHKKGSEESRIRTTIATVPDAPLTKVVIELKGGKKHGLLVNSANICKSPNKAMVKMRAQNGKTHDFNPTIATSCKK